jgi:hypothetical protein
VTVVGRHVDVPPAGSVDTSTRPALSVAAHSLRDAHETDVRDALSTCPFDVATQNETLGHEMTVR